MLSYVCFLVRSLVKTRLTIIEGQSESLFHNLLEIESGKGEIKEKGFGEE